MKRLRFAFFARQCKFGIVLLEKCRFHETFPGSSISALHFLRRYKGLYPPIRLPFSPTLHFIASFPFGTLFFPPFFISLSPSLYPLVFSFRLGFHWSDLITVAYRKGCFCTHVTGYTALTPSIKVNGVVTGTSFFMARPYTKDMILSVVPLLEHVGHDQWP